MHVHGRGETARSGRQDVGPSLCGRSMCSPRGPGEWPQRIQALDRALRSIAGPWTALFLGPGSLIPLPCFPADTPRLSYFLPCLRDGPLQGAGDREDQTLICWQYPLRRTLGTLGHWRQASLQAPLERALDFRCLWSWARAKQRIPSLWKRTAVGLKEAARSHPGPDPRQAHDISLSPNEIESCVWSRGRNSGPTRTPWRMRSCVGPIPASRPPGNQGPRGNVPELALRACS